MLIEVKTKTKRTVNDRSKTFFETYLVDKEIFAEAELSVFQALTSDSTVEGFEILSLRISSIKELYHVNDGDSSYIATLTESYVDEEGVVKTLRYRVLLWADSLAQANARTQEFAREGYDMNVESITAKDISYLQTEETQGGGNGTEG